MGKEFKEWERKFTTQELRTERARWLTPVRVGETLPQAWPHKVQQWDQKYVQICVYGLASSVDWQRFRCSMKGTTTPEKLYMLNAYGEVFIKPANQSDVLWHEKKINMCRVDNYIGALVRGGQLSSDRQYRVLK